MSKPTPAMLEKWLREWQAALRLRDWEIKIELMREKTMKLGECQGLNHYSTSLKTSAIQVRDALDDNPNSDFPSDVEATIVHELLHLHFSPFMKQSGLANTFMEQAIEVMAQSFVALKRRGQSMAAKKSNGSKGKAAVAPGGGKPEAKMPPGGKGKPMKGGKGGKAC